MMIDNLQLELLSVQFCGELMPQAPIDMSSIIDISNHYLTVKPPRLPVSVFGAHWIKWPTYFWPGLWPRWLAWLPAPRTGLTNTFVSRSGTITEVAGGQEHKRPGEEVWELSIEYSLRIKN